MGVTEGAAELLLVPEPGRDDEMGGGRALWKAETFTQEEVASEHPRRSARG